MYTTYPSQYYQHTCKSTVEDVTEAT